MASQVDRVLALLRERGDKGVHTFELRARYIGNPSERVRDLVKKGYRIDVSERERLNCGDAVGVRYFLVGEPVEQASGGRAADHISAGLTSAEPVLFARDDGYKDAVA